VIQLAFVFYFVFACIGFNILISFTDWSGLKPLTEINLIGLENYVKLIFFKREFHISFLNNMLIYAIVVPASIGIGLLLSSLLHIAGRSEPFFRTCYLLPFSLAYVVVGILWLYVYYPNIGILNTTLKFLHLPERHWLSEPQTARFALLVPMIWQYSGFAALVLLGGLRSIPLEIMESAKIDGASGFTMFRYIVLPHLRYPIYFLYVIISTWALMTFDLIWIMTGGGPGVETSVLSILGYKYAFGYNYFGLGAAVFTLLTLLNWGLALPVYFYLQRRGV